MRRTAVLHGVALVGAPRLPHLRRGLEPLVGPLEGFVAQVDAPTAALLGATAGLPAGEARSEAAALRLRRAGWELVWGEPGVLTSLEALVERFEAWGSSSVDMWRADPSLVSELHLGGWHLAPARDRWRRRWRRRATLVDAADSAFWRGVRKRASQDEWRRLTSGYAVLLYHRLAGEEKPGQERVDVSSAIFDKHLRVLRRLGFSPLREEELVGFHRAGLGIGRRRFMLTIDDGFRDCVAPLLASSACAHLFVATATVGSAAGWLDDEQLAGWQELEALSEAGVAIASHSRTHARLPLLDEAALGGEVGGALRELEQRLPGSSRIFAYPYGDVDDRVRAAVDAGGYALAYTTRPGLNGVGTDPLSLRRISVKAWDSGPSVAWKVLTAEPVPRLWEWWLLVRHRARRRLRRWSGRAATRVSDAARRAAEQPRQREP